MPMIKTESVTRRFGDVTAVDGLSLSVSPGQLFGLVGSDGAGKTTTLRMLAGVLDPTSGSVRVLGHDPATEGKAIHADIGYMSQRFGLYPDLTAEENLRFYADLFGLSRSERERRAAELLEFSRLSPFRKRMAGNLSGGMKQKLGLACALIHQPKLLLLDEPTNGVDPVSRRDFWRILHRLLREAVTIIVTTAYLDEAERCTRVGLIHRGRLVGCDYPERLKTLLQGKVLELLPENPRRALPLLRTALPEVSFTIFGDRIHAVADRALAVSSVVEQILPGTPVRSAEPTLEDVLVQAIGESEGVR